MSEGAFIVKLGKLVPSDDMGMELMSKLKAGQEVRVEIKRMRNPNQFKLWWALCTVMAENSDYPTDKRQVSDWLLEAVGHCETVQRPDGTKRVIPKSIAFGNMTQDEWEEIFSLGLNVVAKVIGITENEVLKNELIDMTAQRAA